MIIEMRSYDLLPGKVADYERAFAQGLEHRQQFSKLGAFWHTEFGLLNRVIHLWPYDNAGERDRLRAAALKPGAWPPGGTDLIVSQEAKFIDPAPFSPPLSEGRFGLYEIRTYTVQTGKMGEVIKAWAGMIDGRVKYSPLIFAGATSLGSLNQWIHIWAYKDFAERAQVRRDVSAAGVWPPPCGQYYTKQENMLVVGASFSPLG
ncbi:MAG: NIPSNAP family protein [Chloroflexota bacterium]